MSIIANNLLQGDEGYNISKSLRFRSSANCYLNRTFGTPTSNLKYTMSMWLKRGRLGAQQSCFFSYNGGSEYAGVYFSADDKLNFIGDSATGGRTFGLTTNAVFRDPSAWYHLVFVFDSANATVANRCIIYVNNVFQSLTGTTVPSNAPSYFNTSGINGTIGQNAQNTSYFDGYLAEVNFIDGQALTPSSFGSYNSLTGVWQPAKYTGTYGNNGFYLPFTNNASTTTIGYDFSGNSNNWTTNNISLTAGTTYDSMVDVPTMSALGSNYATLNPLEYSTSFSNIALSNGNLTLSSVANHGYNNCSATFIPEGFKGYLEITCTTATNGHIGVSNASPNQDNFQTVGTIYLDSNGNVYNAYFNTLVTSCMAAPSSGDVIMMAWDFTGGTRNIWFGKNGTWGNNAGGSAGVPSTGSNPTVTNATLSNYSNYRFYFALNNGAAIAANFGQRPFSYTPPTGFVALNTFNLPESSIRAGNKQMDVNTYTGNGGTLAITNSGSMQPDLVWIKGRNQAYYHCLQDVIRGVSGTLFSNDTLAEETSQPRLSSFNGNGFTLTSKNDANNSGDTYVAWQWKAGNSAGSSNTAGSITSTVSANPTAGFSVVTYTGTGNAGATVGHGIGVAPRMVIVKERGNANVWGVGSSSLTSWAYHVRLNATNAESNADNFWNSTAPTSSVFTLGDVTAVNRSGGTYVAYCFAEVAGYSKFGSYTGNGSTDGAFVHLGFRPKFVMIKRSDSSDDWIMMDSSRSTYNVAILTLYANGAYAEDSNVTNRAEDFLSNGFKIRSSPTYLNASGGTYIYMAFAENPFKNALAR